MKERFVIRLSVQAPPQPPTVLEFTEVNNETLWVSWKPSDGDDFVGDVLDTADYYNIRCLNLRGEERQNSFFPDDGRFLISGLESGQLVLFRAIAVNDAGDSAPLSETYLHRIRTDFTTTTGSERI